jgi:hypothetical protein
MALIAAYHYTSVASASRIRAPNYRLQDLIAVHNSMCAHSRDVRFWHKADIQLSPGNVRFWG